MDGALSRVRVLSLNGGSSSLKFALHELGATETRLAAGAVEAGEFSDPTRAVHAVLD